MICIYDGILLKAYDVDLLNKNIHITQFFFFEIVLYNLKSYQIFKLYSVNLN